MCTYVLLAAVAAELLVNSNLEKLDANGGLEGWSLPRFYRPACGEGLDATQGIVFENAAHSNYYGLARQVFEVRAGRSYRVTVQAKSELRKGEVKLCMEWNDAAGNYLSGSYAALKAEEKDGKWHRLAITTPRMPKDAARATVSLYCSPGSVGKAGWDNPSVALVRGEPLTALHCDSYRNTAANDDGTVTFRAVLNLVDSELDPADVMARFSYPGADGAEQTSEAAEVTMTCARLSVPVRDLAGGKVRFELSRRSDRVVLGTRELDFKRVACYPDKGVRIDSRNRLIVGGKRFFPIGMYWSSVNEKELDEYVAGGPFNCLMPYSSPSEKQLDLCEEKGVKVAFSVKDVYPWLRQYGTREAADAKVESLVRYAKDHPATLCYYINDEVGVAKMPELVHRYRQVAALDPDHPAWTVIYQYEEMRDYLSSSDAFGTDPYPNGKWEFGKCHRWVRTQCEQCFGARPQWQAVQVMDHGAYQSDRGKTAKTPVLTEDEMRNMTWQVLVAGADGIFFYSFFDLKRMAWKTPFQESFGRVCRLAKELKGYERFFLSDDEPTVFGKLPQGVGAKLWKCGGEYLLAIVNCKWRKTTVTLDLGAPYTVVCTDLGTPVSMNNGKIEMVYDDIGYSVLRLKR